MEGYVARSTGLRILWSREHASLAWAAVEHSRPTWASRSGDPDMWGQCDEYCLYHARILSYCELINPLGSALALEVEEILHDEHSKYQHVVVFQSKSFGKVLLLDGVIQITDRDEMAYQEMIAHIPLFSHPNPETVLIVGGGDGGVIRECFKHKSVKEVHICEIDQMVIDVSKKYFPKIAMAWDDPRVKLHCGDAAEYIQRPENFGRFDVIISDTSDPVGPAAALFEPTFYANMARALKPGGRIATQGESMWNDLELICRLVEGVKSLGVFSSVEYATTQIPTYPMGQIGFIVCAKPEEGEEAAGRVRKADDEAKAVTAKASCRIPVRRVTDEPMEYYTSELHEAAFVLPRFLVRALEEAAAKSEGAVKKPRVEGEQSQE